MKTTALFTILCFITISFSQPTKAAILIEDENQASQIAETKTAATGLGMRKTRRVGVGLSAAGPLGIAGATLEINFTSRAGLLSGFGVGDGFQAYSFQFKKVLSGEWLLPFMTVGVARWYNFGKTTSIEKTNPSFLADRFMSERDKAEGKIDEFLVFPSVGLQYMQLKGPWAGYSVFAEILLMLDLADFVSAPTGTIGLLYYF